MSEFHSYHSITDIPDRFAIFPLSGAILLPRCNLPLNIFEPRYLAMVDHAFRSHRLIGMIQPLDGGDMSRKPEIYSVGGLGRITALSETNDGRYLITLRGISRFSVVSELSCDTPFRQVTASFADFADDLEEPGVDCEIERDNLLQALAAYMKANNMQADWDSVEQAPGETLVNSLSMISPFDPQEKQALVEAPTLLDRARILTALLQMASTESPGSTGGSGTMQ